MLMAAPAPAVGDYYQSAQGKQHRCRMWLQPPSQGKADDECLGTLEPGTRFGPVEEIEDHRPREGRWYLAVKVPHPDADLGDPNSLRVRINVNTWNWVHGSWRLVQFASPSAPPEAKGWRGQKFSEREEKDMLEEDELAWRCRVAENPLIRVAGRTAAGTETRDKRRKCWKKMSWRGSSEREEKEMLE